MPFRSNDTKNFKMGFTSARGFDRISFQDKRFRLGKATISDLRVTENLTVGGKLEAPIVGWDNGDITATTTLTATGTTQDFLKVTSANAVTITTQDGPDIAAAFRSEFKRPTVQVGDVFKQTISKVGANAITLTAGSGVSFVQMTNSSATSIAANKSAEYIIKCTNATVGSETFVYYRVDTEDTAGSGGLSASDNITFTGDCSFTHANGLTIGTGGAAGVLDTTGTQNLELKTGSARGSIIIKDAADADIEIKPNGSGNVAVGSGAAAGVLESNGSYDLKLQTGNATTGTITITDGADGNIEIAPNGTGGLVVGGMKMVRVTGYSPTGLSTGATGNAFNLMTTAGQAEATTFAGGCLKIPTGAYITKFIISNGGTTITGTPQFDIGLHATSKTVSTNLLGDNVSATTVNNGTIAFTTNDTGASISSFPAGAKAAADSFFTIMVRTSNVTAGNMRIDFEYYLQV
jgi:hypothetical protein